MRVVDIWESAEDFQNFINAKVMPAVQQLGITSQPDVKILPAHNVFIPKK
jgi:heme-degrading monooxygenase HmoA